MSWHIAAPIAARLLALMELPQDLRGRFVGVPLFPDDATCQKFYPGRSLDLHKVVNTAIELEVRRRGGQLSPRMLVCTTPARASMEDLSALADRHYVLLPNRGPVVTR